MNISKPSERPRKAAFLLKVLGQTERLQILLAIGHSEACVCHLEAALGLRQAYISQHLMALRRAGILKARREGRFIFYRLKDPALLDLLERAGRLAGVALAPLSAGAECGCPKCGQGRLESALADPGG